MPTAMKPALAPLYQFGLLPLLMGGAVLVWWQSGGPLDWDAIRETTRRLTPVTMLWLCCLHLLQQVVRTSRLSVLLDQPVIWRRLVAALMLHDFLSTLMPLKSGTLSLPELLHREGVSRSRTVAAMVSMVGLDLVAFLVPLLIVVLAWRSVPVDVATLQQPLLWLCAGLVVLSAIGLSVVRRIDARLSLGSHAEFSGLRWLFISQLRGVVRVLARFTRRQLLVGLFLSLLNLATAIAFSLLFIQRLTTELGWQSLLAIVLIMRIAGKFALQGFAGVGTNEPILVFLLCAAGLSASESLTVTLLGRGFHLGLTTLCAAVGGVLLCLPCRSNEATECPTGPSFPEC